MNVYGGKSKSLYLHDSNGIGEIDALVENVDFLVVSELCVVLVAK